MTQTQNSIPVYDRDKAVSIAGNNPSIADELLDLLIQELPLQLEYLRLAYAKGELELLRQTTHQLHGSASYCAASALKAATLELEVAIVEAQGDLIPKAFDQVLKEIHRLLAHCETRSHPIENRDASVQIPR
jgi:HPt (histidine-containing phosphotransfer) domain-containing protein